MLSGEVEIPSLRDVITNSGAGESMQRLDVTCRSPRNFSDKKDGVRLSDPFVLQVRLVASILDRNHPFIEIFLEPRLLLENKIPVRLTLRTPMPHTFKSKASLETRGAGDSEGHDIYHELAQGDLVEVYTPGPSIALSVKCADPPVGGRTTDWMEGGWVDIPLRREFGLPEPLRCVFPFARRNFIDPPNLSGVNGTEFFIVESGDDLSKLLLREETLAAGKTPPNYDEDTVELVEPKALMRKILFTVCNYAVDHTGDILFEMANDEIGNGRRNTATIEASSRIRLSVGSNFPPPFSAYSSGHRRITLLPHEKAPLRLLHLTMEGDEGVRRSKPFFLDDVSTSEGGVDSMPIRWQDNSESGYYAYRKLVDTYQFEVHVIPDFILFNGSKEHRVLIKQQDSPGKILEPGRTAPIKSIPNLGLIISIEFIDLEARTASMRVDLLGLRVAIVKSRDGLPLGSLAVQTVIGNKDSRLVVKLGKVKFGSMVESDELVKRESQGMLDSDVLRFRIRWSELQVTLNEARTVDSDTRNDAFGDSGLDHFIESLPSPLEKKSPRQKTWMEARREQSREQSEIERQTQLPVCTIVFQRFTVDWQRIFKDGPATTSSRDVLSSPERSQFSAIVHNVKILDETVGSKFPVVFDSSSSTSFFDLCIRCRGPLGAELVKVDLLDLNLAHAQGKSEKIVVQTTEEFIWKAIDVVNRIIVSTAELAGIDLKLEWDEEDGGYIVLMKDMSTSSTGFNTETSYTPPQSETLYDITKARVSPFEMVVSFRRRPQSSRYKHLQDVRGAKLMNYFTERMKFKIDRAELKFSRYEASNIKGPPDRLIELLLAVYSSRMKYKVISMLKAVSFEDWRNLAARDAGGDDFVDGDLLRVTGNLAGSTAGYVATKVGRGLGSGVIRVTSALGNEIEEATDKVGARAVGAGVNSVVSGLGGGVGNTIKGGKDCDSLFNFDCNGRSDLKDVMLLASSGHRNRESVAR
jgi:vacuolar protein sorting-associated protein 13A/C